MNESHMRFSGYGDEPAIAEMLDDPIVHLVMRRDGVNEADIVQIIASARRSFEDQGQLNYAA